MSLHDPAAPWSAPPAGKCQPGMVQLRSYLASEFPGFIFAGCYVNRPMSGGSTPSLHRDGRALDAGWSTTAQRSRAIDRLVEIGEQIGVQLILDYINRRSWKPGRGWQPWNAPRGKTHIHVEMTIAGALDTRPITDRLAPPPTPPTAPSVQELGDDVRVHVITIPTSDAQGKAWWTLPEQINVSKIIALTADVPHPPTFGYAVPQLGLNRANRSLVVEDWLPSTELRVFVAEAS